MGIVKKISFANPGLPAPDPDVLNDLKADDMKRAIKQRELFIKKQSSILQKSQRYENSYGRSAV